MSAKLTEFVAEAGQWGMELYGEALEETKDPNKALAEARRRYNSEPKPTSEADGVWAIVDQANRKPEKG